TSIPPPPGREPPLTASGPPNRRPRTSFTVSVDSVKLTLPLARSNGGSCGCRVRLLLANWYSPASFVAARLPIGSSSFTWSLPLPTALIDSVKPPVMRFTGVAPMNLRKSPVVPSAWPLMTTRREPVARRLAHDLRQRQVAGDLRAVGAVQLRREVDRAAAAAGVGIGTGGVAAEVSVGEVERREAHCDLVLALALPVDAPVQGFE